ncbi:SMP-30/gluconolactonase/LRE family protein [Mycolicibacterium bacteremicum]|uniref:3-hydroxyacyl-CoA dehydrogenase n=1 Tax=Mycolicibacterium bacteremicum TaxID=564198 RepID=A0A1W9YY68_MYCBA|nr:hypothetical protein [Mycolicibacterium bacteremicum]MCV7430680.1 hypothetical protein [Mycolicibacterium bacteremicum]ORA04985.1 hypothetical protein BST17_12065 [Mycolicibacterium bacteremicum]
MFTHLLALNPGRQMIVRIDIAGGNVDEFVTGVTAFPDGIVVDARTGLVYWTNMGAPRPAGDRPPRSEADLNFSVRNGSLERVRLDGTGREVVVAEGGFVTGKQLAGAWARNRLYWSDREGAAVRSLLLDTFEVRDELVVAHTEAERLSEVNQCVGVAVDERNGHLYWTQKGPSDGGQGRILRSPLDVPAGRYHDVEVLWSGLPEPIDLELDLDAGLLYWTDRGAPPRGNTLNRAEIGDPGGAVDIVADGFHEAIGLALDPAAGVVYVSDLSGEIRAVDIAGGAERTVARVPGGVTGIAGL